MSFFKAMMAFELDSIKISLGVCPLGCIKRQNKVSYKAEASIIGHMKCFTQVEKIIGFHLKQITLPIGMDDIFIQKIERATVLVWMVKLCAGSGFIKARMPEYFIEIWDESSIDIQDPSVCLEGNINLKKATKVIP